MSMKPDIIFENEFVVAINKPSGLVVHSDGKTEEPSVVDWLLETFPEVEGVGESGMTASGVEVARPGIVHRIDRDTSGVLVIARTEDAYKYLKRQFKQRTIKKRYRAFVYGKMKQERGSINRPIGRHNADFRRFTAQKNRRGNEREAITSYSVRETSDEASYIDVMPLTGRTHQIRVHMKALHHPVICDSLYAHKQEPILGFKRLALHAHQITFIDPARSEHTVVAPLPDDFLHAEALLQGDI